VRAPSRLLFLAFLAFSCAHVDSSLQIDGRPYVADHCQSGEWSGFFGVVLSDSTGRRVRLDADLQHVAVAAQGNGSWDSMGICGGVHVYPQHSKVIARNLEGSATLSCKSEQHTIVGQVAFKNCH
jgi:hypothetical protein